MKRRPSYIVFLILISEACDLLHYSNLVLLKYDKYSRKSEPISEESDALVFKIPTIAFFLFLVCTMKNYAVNAKLLCTKAHLLFLE